jgi:signal transduction histidine kinase/ligand-binding sensor domain-containing protein
VVALVCPCAFALNPALDVSQYAHTAWTIRDGFFQGGIQSIAQTPDGFLWLGTEFGLLRFDGVRTVPWTPPGAERLPSTKVLRLMVARDGTLWIGTYSGLASWNGARLTRYRELDGKMVVSLLEDRGATVWAGGWWESPTGRLCAIKKGTTQCFSQDGSFGQGVLSLFEDGAGTLWAGAQTGLWHWEPGPPRRYALPTATPWEIRDLNRTEDGQILLATDGGMEQLVNGRVQTYPIPKVSRVPSPLRLLRDRGGGLWIGTTDRGLVHIHQGRTDVFSRRDGLSGDFISSLFEDREGNIWAATDGGLDRFREFAIPSITVKEGLSNGSVWSVMAATDGSVWLGTRAGLNKWSHGQIASVTRGGALLGDIPQSLFEDDHRRIWMFSRNGLIAFEGGRFTQTSGISGGQVHAITGDDRGNLWLAHDRGLFHLRDDRVVELTPWQKLGNRGDAYALVSGPDQGLWIGFGPKDGGIVHLYNGQVGPARSAANGLGGGMVSDLRLDRDGTLWAATEGGLSVIKNGRVTTLASRNGLCDSVLWTMEDDDHAVWLYTPCGLMRVPRPELEAAAADPNRTIRTTVFDTSDGVRLHSTPVSGYSPQVTKASDGKLWFLSGDGVSVVDPGHLPVNKLPPPVHIEQITADRKSRWQNLSGASASNLRLPALSDLEIEYTALSFVAPEKVRFRVKLEGRDRDWKDMGNDRKTYYNDLPPRHYRFRVAASNNSGVWNEAGDSLDFSVDPAYYQTTWFRLSCVAAFFALLWALYRYRLHQIAREFNAHLEGRVDERLRVARDLHDTLLQSFHGLLLRFQGARNLLPARVADSEQVLDSALDAAARAITEARDAVQGMRSSTVISNELAKALEVLGKELAEQQKAANGDATVFSVDAEGTSQDLHPILRDDIYRIAGEALRNAFRHARARRIEVDIRYDARQLQVRVRDDGIGIDASVLNEGRAEHWGLPGMRERAKAIGGKLEVWSEHGAGTEVELTIPASIAYGTRPGRRFRL